MKVTFQRLDHRDNPKVNAIIIWKGSIDRKFELIIHSPTNFLFEEIPKLPPILQEEVPDEPLFEEEEEDESLGTPTNVRRNLKTSGPKVVDPYAEDQSSTLLPLIIALAAIIPVLFCLCRL